MTYGRGFTMGTFDCLHVGHLELLRRAKGQCYYLVAGVIDDKEVTARKNRVPYESVHRRAAHIAEVQDVDAVIKVYATAPTSLVSLWETHKFDVLFVGDDWADKVHRDPRWQVVVFPRTPNVSTTAIRGDVRFPLVTLLNFIVLAICLVGIYLPLGIGLILAISTIYMITRRHYGRIRVHDWLNRVLEGDE